MQLPKDAVTCMATEGRYTLQIPTFSIGPETYNAINEKYLLPIKSASTLIASGKEIPYACTYLSRKGFNFYQADLKKAFDPTARGGSWNEYVLAANEWLDKCEKNSRKALVKLQALNAVDPDTNRIKKANELANYLTRM